MATTLCFDFGNTRLKFAVFIDGEFLEEQVLADYGEGTISLLMDRFQPSHTILSSVIDHPRGLEALLRARSHFHRLDHLSKLPITTPVGKPDTIGADRLALTAAAVTRFPGRNNLVIGLGSAVTFNFVNKYNEFLGGGISPGMEMRFKSLHQFTAKLPLVKADWNFPLVGYDTRTNILSGVILGMVKEIDGMIGAYEEKYDNFNVLMSGGDAAYFTGRLTKKITVDPFLIFKGLYAISQLNA